MPARLSLQAKITRRLMDMLCEGGGDITSLQRHAAKIEALARDHIKKEQKK